MYNDGLTTNTSETALESKHEIEPSILIKGIKGQSNRQTREVYLNRSC